MATISITTTGPQATRLATAFGAKYTLVDAQGARRMATDVEIKAWIIQQLRDIVIQYETAEAAKAITITSFDPT